jgi:TRAP-type C4-dicarboxylate transport system permease small subunit
VTGSAPSAHHTVAGLLGRALDAALHACAVLGALILLAICLLVTWVVISRRWLGAPLGWNVELTEYALLYLTFLATAWVLRQDGHVRVDVLVNVLTARAQRILRRVTDGLALAVCLLLAYYAFGVTAEAYRDHLLLVKMLTIPKWPILAVVPLGFLLLAAELVRGMFRAPAPSDASSPRPPAP